MIILSVHKFEGSSLNATGVLNETLIKVIIINLMNNFIIQGIGFFALLFIILSFQNNKRYSILFFLWIAQVLFAIHFGFLGAWTAVAMNGIGAARTYIFNLRNTKKWADNKLWIYSFLISFWISGAIVWEDYYSLLAIIAMTIETVGLWMRNPTQIRVINLFPLPLWFLYNLMVNSYAGMVTEILILFSIFLAIIRYDILKKKTRKLLPLTIQKKQI